LDKLLCELLGAFSRKDKSGDKSNSDRNALIEEVLERVEREVYDISFGQSRTDLVHLFFVSLVVERDVEDLQDLDYYLLSCFNASSAFYWPFLNTQQLVISHHRAEQLHAILENLLHEFSLLVSYSVVDKCQKCIEASW